MDSAILNQAARVISEIEPGVPADAALRRFLGLHRHVGPRERRAISKTVFIYFRWLNWLDEKASRQRQLAQAVELQERFDRNPRLVKPEALAALAVPPWLASEMDLSPEYLRLLQRDPALWLRARPGTADRLAVKLKIDRGKPQSGLTPYPPDALRYEGNQDLFLTPSFHAGEFEIQDLASQWVGVVAAPEPGETWWDRTAGEGGKTVHLADLMQNRGVVWATDRSERRLAVLQKRATRAKLFNIRVADRVPRGRIFDGILLDAPCSGVGTWQRNPHARWTTTPEDVAEMAGIQRRLLDEIAPQLKPGGRLVYAVCTLTRTETRAVADGFSAAHADFESLPIGGLIQPQAANCNGMFVAAWRRK